MTFLSKLSRLAFTVTIGLGAAIPVLANATVESNAAAIDLVWMLICAVLVFMMQAGFAMVEAGFTRAKSSVNIIMKNLMDFSVGSIAYFAIGFGLMFGTDVGGFIGGDKFFLSGLDRLADSFDIGFWMFQVVFAAAAATIVSGAMAERTKFSGYLFYSIFICGIIYPIQGHWSWGGGWLGNIGFSDFAGSTVVHSVGGWAALVGAWFLGPRIGKYTSDGKPKAIMGHNIPIAALGVFLLWFGWFGFNAGSTTSGTDVSIAIIMVCTNLAAAGGAVAAMFTSWKFYGKPDASFALNGALAGLVGITAGCASVSALGALIIGALSGVVVVLSVEFIDRVLKIDDPVGAISVHGVCGAFGTLAVGLFDVESGLFYGGGAGLLGIQTIGILAVFIWTVVTSAIVFGAAKALTGLRVSRDVELKGLDISEHAMEAYSGFQVFSNQ